MKSLTAIQCPICRGPIAFWVVGKQFNCHHCNWTLASNEPQAFRLALGLGLAVGLLAITAAFLATGSAGTAISSWLEASGMLGCWVGYLGYAAKLAARPIRPPLQNAAATRETT